MHLSDVELGAVLERSRDSTGADAARAHAATCSMCDDAIREAEGAEAEAADVLRLLDHVPPPIDLAAMQVRWAEIDRSRRPHVSPLRRTLRRSAIILAVGAAAAAAAVPRSPIRRFITQVVSGGHTPLAAPSAVTAPSAVITARAAAPVTAAAPRGVAIAPARRAAVIFRGAPAPGSSLHVRGSDGARVAVTANTDEATYTVGTNTITVDVRSAASATYDIELPPPARVPDVDIRVDSHVVYSRHAGTVVTNGARQSDGSYIVPMR